jgi:tRNA dimethylallyltransferase
MKSNPFANAFILTGPTASGKSALALELAERHGGEIIAADSMTLYRSMNIGTAKPSAEERARVPHHLIDVLDPTESANVAWWLARAAEAVGEIEARGKTPLIVGGTPFYLKALLCGIFDAPPVDPAVRERLEQEADDGRSEELHARLRQVDPPSAARLHVNDVRRVVRALEVWESTGKPISEWQKQSWWDGEEPRFAAGQCVAIDLPRPELFARIETRVEQMFAAGWVEEVEHLRKAYPEMSREASRALGYSQIAEMLDGRRSRSETIEEIQLRTRQFAKRQLTWFRGLAGVEFANPHLTFERGNVTMGRNSKA